MRMLWLLVVGEHGRRGWAGHRRGSEALVRLRLLQLRRIAGVRVGVLWRMLVLEVWGRDRRPLGRWRTAPGCRSQHPL